MACRWRLLRTVLAVALVVAVGLPAAVLVAMLVAGPHADLFPAALAGLAPPLVLLALAGCLLTVAARVGRAVWRCRDGTRASPG